MLDHESFSLTKTHITNSISAYVSFIYRMAVERSGFLASISQHRHCSGFHVERTWTFVNIPEYALSAFVLMGTNVFNQNEFNQPPEPYFGWGPSL